MNAEADLDRSEAASPHKLSEAHRRGQVPKSIDVVSAVVFAAAVGWSHVQALDFVAIQLRMDRALLGTAMSVTAGGLAAAAASSLVEALESLLPLLVAITLAAIAGNLAQTGLVFSAHPLKPDWNRIAPLQGLRRVFSERLLFDLLRLTFKIAVVGTIVYHTLRSSSLELRGIGQLTAQAQLHAIVSAVVALGLELALALAVLAALDLAHTRHAYARRMRMSRRELLDELKHREGDPRIRSRLRALRHAMLKRSLALRRTREADVLIVNPTHLAIALRYRTGSDAVPKVLCKGTGLIAQAMRRIAARHRIAVVHSPMLARSLHASVEIEQDIPVALYPDVARIMVWVLARRGPQ